MPKIGLGRITENFNPGHDLGKWRGQEVLVDLEPKNFKIFKCPIHGRQQISTLVAPKKGAGKMETFRLSANFIESDELERALEEFWKNRENEH